MPEQTVELPLGVLGIGPQGSHIIAIKPSIIYEHCQVVLAVYRMTPEGYPKEWVTWIRNYTIKDSFSWGHYIVEYKDAIKDFNERN